MNSSTLRPGERLRVLARLSTPAGTLAEMAYAPGWCEGRHRHGNASLIYIASGDHWATHSLGGDVCKAGTVRYLPAGEPHATYFPLGSICLQLELEPALVGLAAEHGRPRERPGEIHDVRAAPLGARLHRELFNGDEFTRLDVEGVALELLLAAAADGFTRRARAPAWVLRLGEQLREEPATHLGLQALARSVGRHPVQVSRQFHRHFGCTMSEYARRTRIARAQQLLRHTTLGLTDVALACGFADQSHFTTTFRHLTGIAPGRYRVAYLTAVPRPRHR